MRIALLVLVLGYWPLWSQTVFYPLRDVKPGQKGVGRTIFQGDRIEEFNVEILGLLENIGPRQSIVLARLSGGPLERTGVLQGMSGSPVYLDGKLLGAVALGFPFSKEPIAGIRPIEQMIGGSDSAAPRTTVARLDDRGSEPRLQELSTPVSFSGFTKGTLEQFGSQLRALGLEPRQALSGGGVPKTQNTKPGAVEPGSMISVQLISGDMAIGADGTVTYVDGKRVYAFGHQFMSAGNTELPFARSSVITLLPNVNTSFKISNASEWVGAITQDRQTGVSGEIGRAANLVPLNINVRTPKEQWQYHMRMVNDRVLTPFLLQMAVYSALESTQRTVGTGTFALEGKIQFGGNVPPIAFDNLFTGDFNLPLQVAIATTSPFATLLQNPFAALTPQAIDLTITATEGKRQWQIDQVWASRREVRPGETVEITASLLGPNGQEQTHTVPYAVPIGAPPGTLYFTVADGGALNVQDYFALSGVTPRSPEQLVKLVNGVRTSRRGYVRVWRAEPNFQVQGATLPDPPASLALLLTKAQGGLSNASQTQNAKLAELSFSMGDAVVVGSKTLQVEVRD